MRNRRSCWTSLLVAMGFYPEIIYLQSDYAKDAARQLDLQQWHLQKLKLAFDRIDIDGSGFVSVDELFLSVGETKSPFTDKLFELIDVDSSGDVSFEEYIHLMATYCMFSKYHTHIYSHT